eukprot:CAMPEP_0172699894 /NCGR_PEP_ID=MMETSP1074-20121228/30507_1 /TAXON_ID=2916 /ORGANISM="Ceratium fusus, Strain PA161109" /LENGTH=33 /DNA_ID= /DNA_START= /DNA_END= /DNA_ORIENTATION=
MDVQAPLQPSAAVKRHDKQASQQAQRICSETPR